MLLQAGAAGMENMQRCALVREQGEQLFAILRRLHLIEGKAAGLRERNIPIFIHTGLCKSFSITHKAQPLADIRIKGSPDFAGRQTFNAAQKLNFDPHFL